MPSRCIAGFCSNTHKDGVSLFKFPKDAELRSKWVKQVRRTRDKWEPSAASVLCSQHFKLDCFDSVPTLKESLGYSVQHKRVLLPTAVPTVFPRCGPCSNQQLGHGASSEARTSTSCTSQSIPKVCFIRQKKIVICDASCPVNVQKKNRISIRAQSKEKVVPAYVHQMVLIKEEAPEEWRPGLDQLDPEPLNIKKEEEEEEPCSRLEGEQLDVKEETDVSGFSVTAVTLKSEDDDDEDEEKPLLSQLHQHQVEDRDLPSSSSADQMEAAADGEDCGGAETSRNPDLQTHKDHSSSSETELSEDYEEDQDVDYSDSRLKNLSDSGSKTKDGNKKLKKSRTPESDVNTVNNSLSCSECGKQYVNSSFLQRHMTCHPGGKSSNCLGKIRNIDSKSFQCDVCDDRFSSSNNLKAHMRVHTRDKMWTCDLCEKIFRFKTNFKRHMRVHTRDKLFPCEVCGHRFSQKSSLVPHMRIHTGEKPFAYNVCELRFSKKSQLNSHMRIYTKDKPFPCVYCGQRFSQKANLKTHMRVHTRDKLFPCHICRQNFSLKSHLNSHMKTHTEDKPFSCDVCGHRFSLKYSLNRHMRIHTRDKTVSL